MGGGDQRLGRGLVEPLGLGVERDAQLEAAALALRAAGVARVDAWVCARVP